MVAPEAGFVVAPFISQTIGEDQKKKSFCLPIGGFSVSKQKKRPNGVTPKC